MWREGLFEAALGEASWDGRMEGAEEEEEDEHGCEGENNECDANAEVQMLRKRFGGRGLGGPFCYSLGHTHTHTHRTSAWLSLVLLCLSGWLVQSALFQTFSPSGLFIDSGAVSASVCVSAASPRVTFFFLFSPNISYAYHANTHAQRSFLFVCLFVSLLSHCDVIIIIRFLRCQIQRNFQMRHSCRYENDANSINTT